MINKDTFKVRVFQYGEDWPNEGEYFFHKYDGELYKFEKVENTIFTDYPCGNYVFGTVRLIDIFETEFETAQQYVKDETPIEFVEFKNGK